MATGITELDVWRASDALLLEGARPTIERVRQKIGRGSPNTVSPHLESWFRSLGARIQDPGAFAAPAAVPEPVAQAAAHFWESA
ncbi:DNA-binding protein, partial [Campylobacter lari]|nr:DNA-binding protein [Campylobacter lari]